MVAPLVIDFQRILETLVRYGVDFIVVGGVSAALQGAPLTTFDLDLVHSREPANLNRLVEALLEIDAIYRGRGEQRLRPQASDLSSSGHHLLMTQAGPLDLLGTVGADRSYVDLLPNTMELDVEGLRVRVLNLETLIRLKEETGHPKDKAALPVLLETLRERNKG